MMNKQRFSNFDLYSIQYPFTAIISILHRSSGIFVFLLIPYLLWLLDVASASSTGFEQIRALLTNPIHKVILWFFLIALSYHLVAGIRHLLMDIGFAENLRSGRLSGKLVLGATVILAALIGVWLW